MKLLFVADPLEVFKIYKDTTFAMMREAARRGHALFACEPQDLRWQRGGRVSAKLRAITLTGDAARLVRRGMPAAGERRAAADFDAVLMRKDPPFDSEFFYATHLLEQAEREGARVFNKPAALRDHPEKLAILEFPQFIAPTLVTRDADDVRALPRRAPRHHPEAARRHGRHRHLPRRPRRSEPRQHHRDAEPRSARSTVMAQRYLPEITQGDKRILVHRRRGRAASRWRGSRRAARSAATSRPAARAWRSRSPLATARSPRRSAPCCTARGLLLIGLDVIGDWLTEINVTSPTGFQEITQQTGFDVATMFVDALEDALAE